MTKKSGKPANNVITLVVTNGPIPSDPVIINSIGPSANPAAPTDVYIAIIRPRHRSTASSFISASLAIHNNAVAAPMINLNGNQNQTFGYRPAMIINRASATVMLCIILDGAKRVIRLGANGAITSTAAA